MYDAVEFRRGTPRRPARLFLQMAAKRIEFAEDAGRVNARIRSAPEMSARNNFGRPVMSKQHKAAVGKTIRARSVVHGHYSWIPLTRSLSGRARPAPYIVRSMFELPGPPALSPHSAGLSMLKGTTKISLRLNQPSSCGRMAEKAQNHGMR
jgi:hypothetical protein